MFKKEINGLQTGITFGYWSYVPWMGFYRPSNKKAAWVGTGEKFDFNMMTWLHTCFTFNLEDGTCIMYENGRLVSENKFKEIIEFGEEVANFVIEKITVGAWHPGIVTDFQLFGRVLTHEELKKWTGCKERLEGDLVNWDEEEWIFNSTGNGSRVEYLDFENVVCDIKNISHHFFPPLRTFSKALDQCEKVSGKMSE